MEDKNYLKLAQLYQLLKSNNNDNEIKNYLSFQAIINSDFDINYKLPSNCFLSRKKPEYSGNTVSHFAVEFYNQSNASCMDYLVYHGIDFTIENDKGFSSLLLAIIYGISRYIDQILLYYFERKDFTNYYCNNGLSLLHAASSKNSNLIQYYLSAGAINQQINSDSPIFAGYTPLHFAMHYNHCQAVRLLLSRGANLNIQDFNGMTPLHLLIKINMEGKLLQINEIMQMILNDAMICNRFRLPYNIDFSRIHFDCILGNFELLYQNLHQKPFNINVPLNLDSPVFPGYTPLHFAANYSFRAVNLLLEAKADLLIKDLNGTTPFNLCLINFNLDNIIEILLNEKVHQLSKLKFTNGTFVIEALKAMKTHNRFENYLQKKLKDINTFISFESPVWAGCSLLHLAVILKSDVSIILAHQPSLTHLNASDMSPLHLAFQMKNEDAVSKILNRYLYNFAESLDRDNLSHLHIACAKKNIAAIKYLLKNGANPNVLTLCDFEWSVSEKNNLIIKAKSTPLHVAAYVSCMTNYDLVSILLPYGANPYIADVDGLTPYHIALKYKHKTMLSQMLKSDNKFDRKIDYEKLDLTKLHVACIMRDLSMVKNELELGVDVNKRISFNSPMWPGDTALHILCQGFEANEELIKMLLAAGADPSLLNANNLSPFHLQEVIFIIANFPLGHDFYSKNPINNQGLSHFHLYCKFNNLSIVKNFIDSGINVNLPVDLFADSNAGYTPLHFAVKNKSLEFIELLLSYKADPNIKDADGLTPILLAVSMNIYYVNQVQTLLRYPECDIQVTNIQGDTALEIILKRFPVDEILLCVFLDKGATLEYKKFIAEAPGEQKLINRAIRKLSVDNCRHLMSNISDITLIDDKSQNVIHHVSSATFFDNLSHKFYDAIKSFMNRGCELDHQNNKGKTALHLAASLGRIEMVKVLINLGADINIKDNFKKTPCAYIPNNLAEIEMEFILHRFKLEIFGFHVDVSDKINLHSNEDLDDLTNSIMDEKDSLNTELKNKISPIFSAEYIFSEKFIKDYQNLSVPQRQSIYDFCNDDDIQKKFLNLRPIVNLQFNKARTMLRKKALHAPAANALAVLTGIGVEEMCLEIVEYLNYSYLINLILAVDQKFEFPCPINF